MQVAHTRSFVANIDLGGVRGSGCLKRPYIRSNLQLGDVRNLLASVAGLDENYLRHWATVLGVHELLAETRK